MITYDLKLNQKNSDRFYSVLKNFSQRVMEEINDKAGLLLDEYAVFLNRDLHEKPRSMGEYGVELVTMGILLHRYAGASQRAFLPVLPVLRALYAVRSRYPKLKKTTDALRARITGLFLVPHIGTTKKNFLTISIFNKCIRWLEATGEFDDEAKRLWKWSSFLQTKSEVEIFQCFELTEQLTEWFRENAQKELGIFTSGVNDFLIKGLPAHRFREDQLFCGKTEIEYHINMVASEIVNQGLRAEFDEMKNKVVLLPGCMRSQPEECCHAQQNGLDIVCTGCTEGCRINQISILGQKKGFEVFIVPHSSSFTKWLKKYEKSKDTGVIATACILNIVVGGYQMRDLEIPSQCVLLDFCGCRKHWDPQGTPTDLNQSRLLSLAQSSNVYSYEMTDWTPSMLTCMETAECCC